MELIKKEEKKNYEKENENLKMMMVKELKWIGEKREMIRERWKKWMEE